MIREYRNLVRRAIVSTGQINSAEICTLPDFVNDVSEKERENKERKKKTLEWEKKKKTRKFRTKQSRNYRITYTMRELVCTFGRLSHFMSMSLEK